MPPKNAPPAADLWDTFDPYKHRDRERLRALCCACARRVLDAAPPPHPAFPGVVEVVERYAGGRAERPEFLAARKALRAAIKELPVPTRRARHVGVFAELTDDSIEGFGYMLQSAEEVLKKALGRRFAAEKAVLSALVGDVFGNWKTPVAFDPSWRTEAVVGLARGMYESRDFGPMPVLADALDDAGCASADILAHCRNPAPHVRGCWVVELVLGKS